MNLARLLTLVPLIIALSWLGYLVFKQNLASKTLGSIVSYFIGVVIIFLAVGFLIDSFFLPWINARVQNAENSVELQQFTNSVNTIFDESLGTSTGGTSPTPLAPAATPVIINVAPTPSNGGGGSGGDSTIPDRDVVAPESSSGPRIHTVVSGETLSGIATTYNTTVNDIMLVNGLFSHTIYVGQQLTIPAAQP